MHSKEPLSPPVSVVAEDGEVLIDGPDGLAGSLTPDAAIQVGAALIAAADEARRQTPSRTADKAVGAD